jgi:8-amino-7-oxononanoate synthase
MDCGPVNDFVLELQQRLDTLREQNLFRELRRVDSPQSAQIQIDGRPFLNFSSNDYLGLANHPALKAAAIRALEKFGVGSGASRLVCGSLAPFHELEEALAHFKKSQAALAFSTGYATALGTLGALLGRDDIVILDKLVHASIIEAAKLSGAKIRVFAHNDLAALEAKLSWARSQSGKKSQILVVTETIFSMDGDAAPLGGIVELKDKYGAWLMVDEAHATGVLGNEGRGLADEAGVAGQIEIQMGTLGKALGASGGYICGSRPLVDLLVNRARSFIFSTAPVPASAAAATAAIQLLQSPEGGQRRTALHERLEQFHSQLQIPKPRAAIVPIILGREDKALAASATLRERGIFVPAIRYPSVAPGKARLRVTLSASHSAAEISTLTEALKELEIGS